MKLLFVVGCLLSTTVRAQTDPPPALPFPLPQAPANPNAPEMNTREETAPAFKSHGTLVMVPVVVRNLQGVAVDNLTKASFQLFDKGTLERNLFEPLRCPPLRGTWLHDA